MTACPVALDTAPKVTRAQYAVLRFPPGEYGYAEIEMELPYAPFVAILSSLRATRRRGWIDGAGNITPAGDAALQAEHYRRYGTRRSA